MVTAFSSSSFSSFIFSFAFIFAFFALPFTCWGSRSVARPCRGGVPRAGCVDSRKGPLLLGADRDIKSEWDEVILGCVSSFYDE